MLNANNNLTDLPGMSPPFDRGAFWDAMRADLKQRGVIPRWLLRAEKDPEQFLRRGLFSRQFLKDSLFYACAGNDGRPLSGWSGLVHSYIYMDSFYDDEWVAKIKPWALKGYDCFFRSIVPVLGIEDIGDTWREMEGAFESGNIVSREDYERFGERFSGRSRMQLDRFLPGADGRKVGRILMDEFPKGESPAWICLLRRQPGFGEQHGPRLLSICLISGGAVTHYFHFFNRNRVAPKALCVENPGMCDWVGLQQPDSLFWKTMNANKACMPALCIGLNPFHDYNILAYDDGNRGMMRLWRHSRMRSMEWVSPAFGRLLDGDLTLAAEHGDIDACARLVCEGADVNMADTRGWTALMTAASNGHLEICELLIANGVDVNARSVDGGNALMEAASSRKGCEICKLLLERGACAGLSDSGGNTALTRAAAVPFSGSCLSLLIQAGEDIEAVNGKGETALVVAAASGKEDNCRTLVENGADINGGARNVCSPLCSAVKAKNKWAVRYLIEQGADPDFEDSQGNSLFQIARGIPRNGDIAFFVWRARLDKEKAFRESMKKGGTND